MKETKELSIRWVKNRNNFINRNHLSAAGSFTVEASLIMGFVLMILTVLIYASFYVHDNGVAQGIVCELAAMGNNARQEDDGEKQMENRKKLLITSRFLNTKGVKVSVGKSDSQVKVSFDGSFAVPGFIGGFFTKNQLSIQKSWSRTIYDPADVIRKIRGVKYMAEGMSN